MRLNMAKLMDLSGHRYGKWTVLNRVGVSREGFAIWECKCECGSIKNISSVGIIHKKAKQHCGCDQDWTGKKFGMLTVIRKVSGLGNHASKILCLCDCGNEKIIWGGSLHQGTVKSCGCLRGRTEEHSCLTIVMSYYKTHAKRRNLEFLLNREEFEAMALSPCYYCNSGFSNVVNRKTKMQGTLSISYNGIDRIDNKIGYNKNNCFPCCKKCNMMKGSMEFNDWKEHMSKILSNLEKQSAMAG